MNYLDLYLTRKRTKRSIWYRCGYRSESLSVANYPNLGAVSSEFCSIEYSDGQRDVRDSFIAGAFDLSPRSTRCYGSWEEAFDVRVESRGSWSVRAAVITIVSVLGWLPNTAYGAPNNVIRSLDWVTQNDTVMGGRSRAQLAWNAKQELVWTGDLSLENNGGFVSILTRNGWFDWSAYDGVEVVLAGAGRSIQVTMQRADMVVRAGGYRALVPCNPTGDTRITIPFEAFELKRFGRAIRGPDLRSGVKRVGRLGLLIADKRPGPFRVVLKSIKPVRMQAKMQLGADVSRVLRDAIKVGVPTFNSGDVKRCATLYRQALEGLLKQGKLGRDSWSSRLVRSALEKASKQDRRAAAWTLREAMDSLLQTF